MFVFYLFKPVKYCVGKNQKKISVFGHFVRSVKSTRGKLEVSRGRMVDTSLISFYIYAKNHVVETQGMPAKSIH